MEFDALKLRGGDMGSFVLPLCTEGDKGINRGKNRFVNVLPFDKSRFVLRPVLDTEGFTIPGSDYINANYVSVCLKHFVSLLSFLYRKSMQIYVFDL